MSDTAVSERSARLLSLDFFRGFTMLLLIGEAALVYDVLVEPPFAATWLGAFAVNFQHHPWHGLRAWDLVQPFFMFIVGVAIPFATKSRLARGESQRVIFAHVLKRAALLLCFGMLIHIYHAERIVFQFWNVLAQLAFAYPVAFLLMRQRWYVQIGASLTLIAIPELLYRFAGIPGFDQPFEPDRNFGTYMDFLLMGRGTFQGGHWVVLNAVSTSAHTIWGALVGQLLLSSRPPARKVTLLVLAGCVALLVGFSLDLVTPIIKRIATSSFVFASGGWALLAFAVCYWAIDIKGWRRFTPFAVAVGMNSLFAFLFINLGGAAAIHRLIWPFMHTLFESGGIGAQRLATSLATCFSIWALCAWMYRRRIFINI